MSDAPETVLDEMPAEDMRPSEEEEWSMSAEEAVKILEERPLSGTEWLQSVGVGPDTIIHEPTMRQRYIQYVAPFVHAQQRAKLSVAVDRIKKETGDLAGMTPDEKWAAKVFKNGGEIAGMLQKVGVNGDQELIETLLAAQRQMVPDFKLALMVRSGKTLKQLAKERAGQAARNRAGTWEALPGGQRAFRNLGTEQVIAHDPMTSGWDQVSPAQTTGATGQQPQRQLASPAATNWLGQQRPQAAAVPLTQPMTPPPTQQAQPAQGGADQYVNPQTGEVIEFNPATGQWEPVRQN